MKVSIITATLDNRETIRDCIGTVALQNHENIEHIIIDGGSTDGTVDVIKSNEERITKWTSGPDKGIYHALNRGIRMATGDLIGILHADDIYSHKNVIDLAVSRIVNCDVEGCYGDLLYVSRKNINRTIRYWKSRPYEEGLLEKGWMPPHPTFFVKKEVYDRYGVFNTDYRIAADYELMLRFLGKHKISTCYIPEVLVKMRTGGVSNRSLKNLAMKSYEDYVACRSHKIRGGIYTVLLKNLTKVPQFLT